jgi:hypothetical protein
MIYDLIKIEDLSRLLDQYKAKLIHPDSPEWISFWRDMKKKTIEGTWFEDWGKWRYARGNLGFYHHYCKIPDVDKENKTHGRMINPLIRDLEWHRSYYMCEAMGFSGFNNDTLYTSNNDIHNIKKNKFPVSHPDYLIYFQPDGKFKTYIKPRENLFRLHDKPVGIPLYRNEAKNHLELGCHGKGTKIRMYDGTVKKVEDIVVGDQLMGPDSKPRNVLKLFKGKDQLYKVKQTERNSYVVNSKHILHTLKKRTHKKSYKILQRETELLFKDFTKKKSYKTLIQAVKSPAIEYSKKEYKLHPYFIGLWLGDGFKREKLICFNEDDIEIKRWLIGYSKSEKRFSHSLTEYESQLGTKKMYRFRLIDSTMTHKGNYWSKTFKNNKHIPDNYLKGSIDQRLELLAGLIDSDGNYSIKTHRYTFTNTDKQLIDQVEELCWSLGFKTTISTSTTGITNSLKYNLRIYGNIGIIPCKVKRKKAAIRTYKKRQGCKFDNIQLVKEEVGEFYGFELDNDHLYLLEDYTVTHNSRGGGKSLYYVLAEVFYAFVFDGLKYYTEDSILNPPSIKINVGAGITQKSRDTLNHIEEAMQNLAVDSSCGVWGSPEDYEMGRRYEPNPFWKFTAGSFNTDAKYGWHEFLHKKEGGKWKKIRKSAIYNKSYSSNKKTGSEAGAGGRRSFILYEEIGLFEDFLSAWASDEHVVSIDGVQFAPRVGIGTSGNIETIKASKQLFTHPEQYNILEFPTEIPEQKTGYFLNAIVVDKRYKDENGNTNIEESKKFYEDKLNEKLKTNDSSIINGYKMHKPTKIDHMWVSKTGDLLPVKEAELRELELMKNNLYESIGNPIRLFWDKNEMYGVNYEVDPSLEPFYDDNFTDRDSMAGCIVMYEPPFMINGVIPQDAHIFTHDPYVSDAWDEGGSLGATHVWINPKYIPQGAKGNHLAATYIGKHPKGVDGYNAELEKLLAFYGNPTRMLWYEANRGEKLRSYLIRKKKLHLACLQPQFERGSHVYLRNTNKTGFMVGNQVAKLSMIDAFNDWLLEETEIPSNLEDSKPIQNIFNIPCIFTIRQIKAYKLKGNFDLISSCLGLPLALGEIEHHILHDSKRSKNPLGLMSKILKQRLHQ